MTRKEIDKGIFLTQAEGNYKKSRLSIYLASPLVRETLTTTAMLPFVLERGTARLPDMTLLRRKQNELYGANLSTNYSGYGFARIIEGHIDGVDASLLSDGMDIMRQKTELLSDVLFDPYVEERAFPTQSVDIEREKLREVIRSVINDKREYCAKLLFESFFEGDERALPADGYEQDLASIGGAKLYETYAGTTGSSRVEIIYVGSRYDGLEEAILKNIGSREPAAIKDITAVPKRELKTVTEVMDVEQDKLAMAFTTGRVLDLRELIIQRVASALLGGSPTSRLFMNVREKQSLCYSIGSRPHYKAGGGMVIECGIEHENTARARQAILQELDTLAKEGPTDKELAEIKLLFSNYMGAVYDSSTALAGQMYSTIMLYGDIIAPEKELEYVNSVTAGEVKAMLSEMHLNTISCISKA